MRMTAIAARVKKKILGEAQLLMPEEFSTQRRQQDDSRTIDWKGDVGGQGIEGDEEKICGGIID
jgi:hypothetical protein